MPIRFRVDPRDVPAAQAARRLGLTLPAFEAVLPRLLARGFSGPDVDTGHFDLKAIETWMDRRSGLAGDEPAQLDEDSFRARLATLRRGPRR